MELFDDACELPAEERSFFLDSRCGDDLDLKKEVESLLNHDAVTSGHADAADHGAAIEALALDIASKDQETAFVHLQQIGPYRILREIARGGMGVIYEAEQQAPKRRVALKVIRPGMVTADLLRRFKHEAQILGRLQHPDIAQIFEAGIAEQDNDTLPFFAMELIDGLHLDEFARSQNLDTSQCVALLARVCDAVQHAHQNGIIHRDLKPANILVSDSHANASPKSHSHGVTTTKSQRRTTTLASVGHCKILDFGVARVTDPDSHLLTASTDIGQIIGTLAYMSPEQIRSNSNELDTRCDVYALGVILYEVLAGTRPIEVRGLPITEAARRIEQTEPARLSSHQANLRGDLETIVHKALAKDRDLRYATAGELGADLWRYLHDEPILARPPSSAYYLTKFARRNKALVAALGISLAGLIIALIGVTLGLISSKRQLARSNEMRSVVEDMLLSARPSEALGEDTALMRRVLLETSDRLDRGEVRDPKVVGELRALIASTFLWLEDPSKALEQLDKAHPLLALEFRPVHPVILAAQVDKGIALSLCNRTTESEELLRKTLQHCEQELAPDHALTLRAADALAATLGMTEQWAEAEEYLKNISIARARLLGNDHHDTVDSLRKLGMVYEGQGRIKDAERLLLEALDQQAQLRITKDPRVLSTLWTLGTLLGENGRPKDALPLWEEALEVSEASFGPSHPGTLPFRQILGVNLLGLGEESKGIRYLTRAAQIEILSGLAPSESTVILTQTLLDSGALDECERLALEIIESNTSESDETAEFVRIISHLTEVYQRTRRPKEQEQWTLLYVSSSRRILGDTALETIQATNNLGALYLAQERIEEAKLVLIPVATACSELGDKAPGVAWVCTHSLAEAYLGASEWGAATKHLENAILGYETILATGEYDRQIPAFLDMALAQAQQAYSILGKNDKAQEAARKRQERAAHESK